MRHADDDERSGKSVEKADAVIVGRSALISSLKAGGRLMRNCATSPSNDVASSIEAELDDGEFVKGSLKVRFLMLLTNWAILRALKI
jgi:hypothetical protein